MNFIKYLILLTVTFTLTGCIHRDIRFVDIDGKDCFILEKDSLYSENIGYPQNDAELYSIHDDTKEYYDKIKGMMFLTIGLKSDRKDKLFSLMINIKDIDNNISYKEKVVYCWNKSKMKYESLHQFTKNNDTLTNDILWIDVLYDETGLINTENILMEGEIVFYNGKEYIKLPFYRTLHRKSKFTIR